MSEEYEGLRAALDAGPTPGPWKADTSNAIGPTSREDDQSFGMVLPVAFAEFENGESNRRYIAACSPEVIRALLAERDAYQDALYAIEGLHDYDMPVGEAAMALYEASNIARAALAQGEV